MKDDNDSPSQYTFQEITSAMSEAVDLDGRIKRKFNATVQFDVEPGPQTYILHATKKKSSLSLSSPDLKITTSLATLQELLQKKTTPQKAFLQGKLQIKGKMSLAMKLNMVLDATRKHLLAVQNARL